jgi:hypothetical protein
MHLNAASHSRHAFLPTDARDTVSPDISLGELVELVARFVPEDEVAETVAALFRSGAVSFARLLDPDERAALGTPA